MGAWTLVLRDQTGVELRIAIDETVDAMPGGTNLNMSELRYLGVYSENLSADVCGVTIPNEQEALEYIGDFFGGAEQRANGRLRRQMRPQDNFRNLET